MVESVNILTQTETLLESDMLGTLIASYIFLFIVLFVSFLNIYLVDKFEFLNNEQKCLEFKYKLLFVIMYSDEKHIVSIKTLISELVGYALSVISTVVLIYSLIQDVATAYTLLGFVALLIFVFGCVTGGMYRKIKGKK